METMRMPEFTTLIRQLPDGRYRVRLINADRNEVEFVDYAYSAERARSRVLSYMSKGSNQKPGTRYYADECEVAI